MNHYFNVFTKYFKSIEIFIYKFPKLIFIILSKYFVDDTFRSKDSHMFLRLNSDIQCLNLAEFKNVVDLMSTKFVSDVFCTSLFTFYINYLKQSFFCSI